MAWRFKASKYKNAAPRFPKKEDVITDIPVSDVTQSCGNHIKASCVYTAFNIDSAGGGNLGYLPNSASGRQGSNLSIIRAHGDFVTDLDFSPFDDYLLATGAQDNKVNLWLLPDEKSPGPLSDPVLTLPLFPRRVENVVWNPQADGIIAVTCGQSVKIFNVTGGRDSEVFEFSDHEDQIQSLSWKEDGCLLTTSCRDKKIRVVDPRTRTVAQEGSGHQNVRDSRVLWLAGKNVILSTGFSQARSREVKLWDTRNLSSSLMSMDIDSSTGTLMPFFDPDTSMTFLIGKGDVTLNFLEFTEKEPYLTSAAVDRTEQIKGAALVPKRAMNLMEGEVNRLLVLARNTIIPVPYIVPRKSYRDFHSDLYPDTQDGLPGILANDWLAGKSAERKLIQLEPRNHLIKRERRGTLLKDSIIQQPASQKFSIIPQEGGDNVHVLSSVAAAKPVIPVMQNNDEIFTAAKENNDRTSPAKENNDRTSPAKQPTQVISQKTESKMSEKPALTPKPAPAKLFANVRQSKFRHIQGSLLHPSSFVTNVRNVSKTIPGESNMFAANVTRCAVPLDGAGGCLNIFEFNQAARLQDTGLAVIQNGSKVTDFAWDPFDDSRLVVALDNAKINIWKIPPNGLSESLDEPEFSLKGHMEKIYFVRFHPLASDLIATASYDMTVRLWDLGERKEIIKLEDHGDQIFCLSWSLDGKYFATVCKDGFVRIFDPRNNKSAIKKGTGPEGSRGARVEWVLQDRFLAVSGFNKSSAQLVLIYSSDQLQLLNSLEINVSPAILVPHYDPDTSVLFLTSRGDRIIYTLEVISESPFLLECAPVKLESLHQGLSFLPKSVCDVRKVEIARAWRLTSNSIEALSFTVPRVKLDFFQDDLFPDTRVTWKATLTSQDWWEGVDRLPRTQSLKPADMTSLSQAPAEAAKTRKFESYNADTFKTDEQRKEELLNAVVGKLELSSEPLPQDLAEGVQEDEWDD